MTARLQSEKGDSPTYRQIWRVVDGAVLSALTAHPEFLAPAARLRTVRNSIVKRVVGAIAGYAAQSAWVRSSSSGADEMGGIDADAGQGSPVETAPRVAGLLPGGSSGGGAPHASSHSPEELLR